MNSDLEQHIHARIAAANLLPPGSRVLVAVSGGADSVALLHLLHALAERCRLHLEVAHLDHALRLDSREDAGFVRDLSARLGLVCHVERIDVAAMAAAGEGGLEEVAREQRRAFLLRTAEACACDRIALGHQREDQAETFLLRLLRGAGPAGLAAMRPVSGPFVRPLLDCRRGELTGYLLERGLEWREDHSNRDPRFTRNRVRHELLPLLGEFNPAVVEHLAGLAALLGREEECWDGLAAEALARCRCGGDDGVNLTCQGLQRLPPALAARVVRLALGEVRGDLRRLSRRHVDAVLQLAVAPGPQGELCLPQAWAGRRYDRLWLRARAPQGAAQVVMEIPGPGCYRLPEGGCLAVETAVAGLPVPAGAVEFPAASLAFPLRLRSWQAGDRMRPSGMAGTKKLQDLFVDAKLPREQRDRQLVLESGGQILWVVGWRRCEGLWPVAGEPVVRLLMVSES